MPLPSRCFSSTPPPVGSRLGSLHPGSALTWTAAREGDLSLCARADARVDGVGVSHVRTQAAASRALGLARDGVRRRVPVEVSFPLGSDGVHGSRFSKNQHDAWFDVTYTPLRFARSDLDADAALRLRIRPNGQGE